MCTPGKFQTSLSSNPCRSCEFNTYAPAAGMTACVPCPANSSSFSGAWRCDCVANHTRANSSSGCTPACGAGLAKSAGGDCVALSNASVVLLLDVTLRLPDGATTADVAAAMLAAVSAAFGIAPGYLVATAAAASARRLLQASGVRYAVEVRVLFPAGTSAAEVGAMQSRLGAVDSAQLNAALLSAPEGRRFTVLYSSATATGTGAAPAPSPVTPAPSPVEKMDIVPIIAGAGGGLFLVLAVVVGCIWQRHASQPQ